ncbi:INO80-like protein, partial [Mya arenaria]
MRQYQYYSVGLLSNVDHFPEHQKNVSEDMDPVLLQAILSHRQSQRDKAAGKKLTPEQAEVKRRRLWVAIAKKEIPKAQKQKASARKEVMQQLKKISMGAMREVRRAAIQSQKQMKDTPSKARRLTREMMVYWKRFEKVEKDHRKRVEKEALEKRKTDLEMAEARRQQRKFNFLITQTELYAHFMARKITGEGEGTRDKILQKLEEPKQERPSQTGFLVDTAIDDYDVNSLANATFVGEERPQPSMFEGKLKGYQLKGMNWLASLYDQGINGILADEMGLGKTVQSLSCLAHVAEQNGIWGPFLIVAPASTLHNWQQECSRFVPKFKVVPYWGNTQDRRVLRKFWDSKCINTEEASFHVVITSYQLVIQDVRYFQRINARWKILLTFNCRNRLLLTGTPIQNSMAELWALLHFIMPTLFDSHDEFNETTLLESCFSSISTDQLSRLHMILKPFMLRRVKKDVENELGDKRLLYQGIKNKISIEDLLNTAMSNSSQAQSTANSLMNLVMQFRKKYLFSRRLTQEFPWHNPSLNQACNSSSSFIRFFFSQSSTNLFTNFVIQFCQVCNHPELFERQEIRSGFFLAQPAYRVPKLVYRDGILDLSLPSRGRLLNNTFCIYNTHHIHNSLFHEDSCFSFLRFIDMSPAELNAHMLRGLLVRTPVHLDNKAFLLEPIQTTYFTNVQSSPVLSPLVFTNFNATVYTHQDHTVRYIHETEWHRQVRQRHRDLAYITKKMKTKSPPSSPSKSPKMPGLLDLTPLPGHVHQERQPKVFHCQPTEFPPFLYYTIPKVKVTLRSLYAADRSAQWEQMAKELAGTQEARVSLLYGEPARYEEVRWWTRWRFFPEQPAGLLGLSPRHGYSGVYVP